MKLHLPSSLRKALLACLAALVVPSFTVASGSALFGAALFSYLASASIASAEDILIGNRSDWETARNGEQNSADNTFVINDPKDAEGGFANQFFFHDGNETIDANLRIEEGGWTINNGYSNSSPVYTFNGSVSGTGNITFSISNIDNQTWVFTGDMLGFSGDISVNARNSNRLKFEGNTSGSGSISLSGGQNWLEIAGATMNNASINTSNLQISGSATFNVGSLIASAVDVANDFTDAVITFAGQEDGSGSGDRSGSVVFTSILPKENESVAQWKANITFDAGVSFTMEGDLQLSTDNNGDYTRTYDFGGEVSLGNLTIYGGNGRQGTAHAIFRQGASIAGTLTTGWGSLIELGDDLEFTGAITAVSTSALSRLEGVTDRVALLFNAGDGSDEVELSFADFNGKFAGTKTNLAVGKSGAATLKLTDGGTISTDFKVKEGTLLFAADTTISGYAYGEGTYAVGSGATLTLSGGASIGAVDGEGNLTLSEDTTLASGGTIGTLSFYTQVDAQVGPTLTLGDNLTVNDLRGNSNADKYITALDEENPVELIIASPANGDSQVQHVHFQNVKLVLNFANTDKWHVFQSTSFEDIEFRSAGQIEIQNTGNEISGDVTSAVVDGVAVGHIVVPGSLHAYGNVTVGDMDVRYGGSVTIDGNLTVNGVSLQGQNWGTASDYSISVGGNVTIENSNTTNKNSDFKNFDGSFTMGSAEGGDTTPVFTKKGTGSQIFAGNTTLYGDVDVQAGTLRLEAGEDKGYKDKNEIGTEFSIFGNVTVDDDASFEFGRGTLYLEGGTTFDGTLTVVCQTNSAYNIARLITSGTDTDAAGVTIKALDVGAGAQVLLDHPGNTDRITIQDALQLGGNITVWGTHLILSDGGTVKSGGNLNMAWQAKLELGADLELEGGFSSNTGVNLVRAESAEEEYVYLVRTVDASTGTAGSGLNIDSVYYSITYGEKTGVAVRVRDGGTKIINDWSNENLAAALRIDEGTLLLYNQPRNASCGYNLQGYLSGEGDLGVWNGAVTTDLSTYPANRQTKISGGGKLKGKLYLHEEGAYMTLASNLEVGGIRGEAVTGTAWRHIDTLGEDEYTLTLNVVDTEAEIDADVSSVSFHGNLLLRKIGGGTQRILSSTFEDSISLSVEDGKLILDAANKDQLGSIAVSGSGELVFSDGSGLSGATLSGDFSWDKDVNENLGALTVGGTLYVGSQVPDESTPDPDDTMPRAGTQTLTLTYPKNKYGDNFNFLSDIVIQSGHLDIVIGSDAWGSADTSVIHSVHGSVTGDGGELIVTRDDRDHSNTNTAYIAVLRLEEGGVFKGALKFADKLANINTPAAELQIVKDWTVGSIDVTEAGGIVSLGAANVTLNVTGSVEGSAGYQLQFLQGGNGQNGGGRVSTWGGTVNLQQGGTIGGEMKLSSTVALNIGNGTTLSVGGLSGDGHAGIGVWNADGSTTGSATLEITGTGSTFANYIFDNVTLVLKAGASQTLNGGNRDASVKIDLVQLEDSAWLRYNTDDNMIRRIEQLKNGAGSVSVVNTRNLTIGGGTIGGDLLTGQGSRVFLNGDLTVGGLTADAAAGAASFITILGNSGEGATYYNAFDQHATQVMLTLDVDGEFTGDAAKEYRPANGNSLMKIGSDSASRNSAFTLKKTGAGEQKFAGVDIAADVVLDAGRLTFVSRTGLTAGSTIWGDVGLGTNGTGTLAIVGTKVTLSQLSSDADQNKSTIGALEVTDGATLQLDRNLTVTDLTLDTNANNTITRTGTATTLTINVDGSTVKRGCLSMDKAENSPNDWHLTLSGVKLEKTGSGTYSISGLEMDQSLTVKEGRLEVGNSTIGGDVQIDAGASLLARYALADGRKTVIGGTLSGSGTLMVSATDLELTSTDEHTFSGRLDMNWASHLLLASDLEVSGMISSLGQNAADACEIKLYGSTTEAVFTLNVTDATPVDFRYSGTNANISKLKVESGIKLVKTGSGTQVFYDFGANNVEITEGALRLNVGTYDNLAWGGLTGGAQGTSSFVVNNVLVAGANAALEIGKQNWKAHNGTEGEGTNIKLKDGGTLRSVWAPTGTGTVASNINIGTITLAADSVTAGVADAHFAWSTSAQGVNTTEDWTIYKLTGKGNLELGAATGNGKKKLTFSTITDYEGEISGGSGASVYISSVHQTSAVGAGSITADVRVARDTIFRKTGDGSFSLAHLTVESFGHVYMDYEGSLSVTELDIMSGAYLHYTTGVDATGLLHWTADKLEALKRSDGSGLAGGVYLDISDLLNDKSKMAQLESGICLGITGRAGRESDEALAALKERFAMAEESSDVDFGLRWGDDDYLYLYVTSYNPDESNPWDTRWGLELVYGYPTSHELDAKTLTEGDLQSIITGNDPADEFNGHALDLAGTNYGDNIGGSHYIKLTDGDTADDTKVSIIGGKLYNAEDAVLEDVAVRSFIMLEPAAGKEAAHYHMLVGGSALVNSAAGTGSFEGTSHIEMKGGVVDYIVGGNHVTNREMAFTGNSYISVDGGTVLGSIVGGSTLTRGAAGADPEARDAIEFNGNSNINIYTVLGNGATTPAITTGTVGAEHVAFTAVVGGNAWIELPGAEVSGMAPLFMGSSKINIVLDGSEFDMFPGEQRSGEFAKAIVGGNYTAAFEGSANNGDRSTRFVQYGNYVNYGAQIVIRATDDVVFSGGVNGASRRSSGGSGETYFEGDTLVEIHGGTYTNIVAGGLWFDEAAAGAHSSQFFGNTLVQINSGNLWRVVGGSVSLGGSGSTSEAEDSNTQVLISGGSFGNKAGSGAAGALTQADIGFVVGGDLYKNTGTYGTASGSGHVRTGNTNVTITGGTFTDMHIVGGDYANFTGATSAYGPVINGTSTVTIGGAGSVTISGLVVGGSYLTDEGSSGQVTINGATQDDGSALATHVVISEGASVSKGAEASGHTHSDIAVVAGHAMIDENVGGGHLAHISGDTWVELTGGEVHGTIVGGSYTSACGGTNTLSIDGTSRIDLTGGVLEGDVVGGHYSENTDSPDALSLGDVTITLDGAEVTGNIIGGSHRAAEKALGTAPTQKNITIDLVSGSLTGNVYAAGEHVGATVDGTLNVATESTTVNVGEGMIFAADATVSGGYAKAASTAQDASTVTGAAKLVIEGGDANLYGVNFVDFDHVDNAQDVMITGRFSVLDRGADTRLTKQGAGHLSLSQGLTAADGGAYAGAIELSAGTLSVGKDLNLASVSALVIDLAGRTANTKDTAWLSAESGAKLLVTSGSITDVELKLSTGELAMGTYYLTGELNGGDLGMTGAEDYFSQLDDDDLAALGVDSGSLKAKLQLLNNCLVLRVSSDNPYEWYWEGGEDDEQKVWDNSSSDNWTRDIDGGMDAEQTHQDVHFNGGAAGGDVHIAGKVTPANVFIESGSFTFSQKEGAGTGGMELDAGGILYVGVGTDASGYAPDASLELALDNTRIPKVQLNQGGVLILSSAEAVQAGEELSDNAKTKIDFNGGLLVYGENADGTLAFTQDLSSHVLEEAGEMNSGDWNAENQNGGIIRLQIGNSADAPAALSARAVADELPTVVWDQASSGTATNYGVERILSVGIEKSGRGTLEVVWSVDGNASYNDNVIESTEGLLVYKVTAPDGSGVVTIGGAGTVRALDSGAVQFVMERGFEMRIERSFYGEGTVIIGDNSLSGYYILSSNNREFAGTIELMGDNSGRSVQVTTPDALLGSKLVINGRGISFSNDVTATDGENGSAVYVRMPEVEVKAGSQNFLGGSSVTNAPVNAHIILTGKLTGSGMLAAAAGADQWLTGDVSAFTGTLLAQAANTQWRLAAEDAPEMVQANFNGAGLVNAAFGTDGEDAVRFTGQFAGDVRLSNLSSDVKVVLAAGADKVNTSRGALVFNNSEIQLGDETAVGTWTGGTLQLADGADSGTFRLVSGTLYGGITADGKGAGVQLVAETSESAATRVNVGGTQGSLFDAITVNAGGHVTGLRGNITAGEGSGTTKVKLVLDKDNIGSTSSSSADDFLLGMQSGGKLMIDGQSTGFGLEFTSYALIEALLEMRTAEMDGNTGEAFLHLVTGGSLVFGAELEDWLRLMAAEAPNGYTGLLADLGFKLSEYSASPGEMLLTGSSKDVYLVLGGDDARSDDASVTKENKSKIEGKKATVVGPDATLDVTLDGADSAADPEDSQLTMHNLVGVEDSTLHGHRTEGTEGDVTLTLDNTYIPGNLDDTGLDGAGVDREQTRGQNTTFEGTIIGDEGVNFDKTGKGTLTVGSGRTGKGGVDIQGNLTLSEGSISIEGSLSDREESGNFVGALEFNYDAPADADEERGFTFRNGTTTTNGIHETGAYLDDNVVNLEQEGQLIYAGDPGDTLKGTRFASSDGSGTLTVTGDLTLDSSDQQGSTNRLDQVNVEVAENGHLNLTGGSEMKGGNATVQEGGNFTLAGGSSITGRTDVSVEEGGSMTLSDDSVLNTTGTVDVQGTLTVTSGSELHAHNGATVEGVLDLDTSQNNTVHGLTGSGTLSGNEAGLTVQGSDNEFSGVLGGSGRLTVDPDAELVLDNVVGDSGTGRWDVDNRGSLTIDVTKGAKTRLGELHMASDSETTLKINTENSSGGLDLSGISWEDGAMLTIESTSPMEFVDDALDLGWVGSDPTGTGLDLKLKGAAFLHYEAGELYRDISGHLKLGLNIIRDNLFYDSNMSKNELAGADMFWNASSPNSGKWRELLSDPAKAAKSDLYKMIDSLTAMVQEGKTEGMGRVLAAGAGASVSVLGSALSQDIQRQLSTIRNRTTTMSPEPRYDSYEELPFYHVWLNGEGSYHKLKADGMAPGYSLNSWGGTLGADADVSPYTTVGLALTAMYGDLKADAADSAKGDLDTWYLSAFARMSQGAWMHTFVMSGGLADVKLNRTVDYGAGSYSTQGSTSGYALAAMYELGYAQVLNAEGTTVLQSVFNVTYRHAAVDGYTESGSDAGLHVGDISHDVVTLGAGARLQSVVAQNAFNRSAIFEGRMLVKGDLGDRSGTATNRLINGDGTARELESAKVGAVGLEMGVGLSIPVGGLSGTVFMDASVELRRGYTTVNANVGYRYNF